MNATRLVALLVATALTAAQLLSLDYYTARLSAHHMSPPAVLALIARP